MPFVGLDAVANSKDLAGLEYKCILVVGEEMEVVVPWQTVVVVASANSIDLAE